VIARTLILLGLCSLSTPFGKVFAAQFVNGVATLSGTTTDGNRVQTIIKTSPVNKDCSFRPSFGWGWDERHGPKVIINSFEIVIKEERSILPLSAYSDLGDPRNVEFKARGDGFTLVIVGGGVGAGDSYYAELIFERGYLRRRKVFSKNFPEAWEETTYSFVEDWGQ